jgi:hypothetical protein
MRRWVCIASLLAGFAGPVGAATRPHRDPVGIERPLERYRGADGLGVTAAWWRRP